MYMVKNITKNEVVLGDIHVSISPGRSIDLDMIQPRNTLDQSRSLSIAIREKLLQTIRKDDPFSIGEFSNNRPKVDAKQDEVMGALKDMEKRITDRLNSQISAHVNNKQPPSVDSENLQSIVNSLQQLVKQIPNSNSGSIVEDIDIDESKKVDIHARAVSRMTKEVKGNIKYEETKGRSSLNNLDELEGLMGQ